MVMKLLAFCPAFLSLLIFAQAHAKIQSKRGVAQAQPGVPGVAPAAPLPAAPMPPPPPGPPPDFIDDETEFDDGDDLPEDYPMPMPNAGRPPMPGQPPFPGQQPFPQQGQMPQQNQQPPPPPMPPPPPPRPTNYANDRPRLTGGKLHFKVVADEFGIPGERRKKGKKDQQ